MTVFPMAMALGLRPLPVRRRAWPRPAPWPGPWPRHKQISKGQGTSKSPKAKAKANGHKLVAMAQDIRYPGVRVGEACGPWTAPTAGVRDGKIYAYHYHTIMGLSHYPSHGHGRLELRLGNIAWVLGPWPWPKPWPKILDIRGCAWGDPVGRGRPI